VYAELHANFRSVVDDSFRAKVWIVSPTTLWATLTTILAVLRDVKMREQAAIIQREVDLLLTDIHRLGDRVEKLSRHFDQTKNDIDQIKISAGKVAYRGEKIVSLELDDNDDADEQSLIEKSVSPRVH
ncbi:MAG: DNA recombination protein RmuC, partial [Kiloniellales bacterium]|nr:DNA recombination protein RmuC [Kiloniellales bacterium]